MDKHRRAHIGLSSRAGGSYIYQTEDMDSYQEREREVVDNTNALGWRGVAMIA